MQHTEYLLFHPFQYGNGLAVLVHDQLAMQVQSFHYCISNRLIKPVIMNT